MIERRKYIRIPEKLEVSYSVLSTTTLGQYTASDISQEGIKFLVHQFIPKDSRMKVRISLGAANMTVEALVQLVWIKKLPYSGSYEVGARFIDIPQKAADHLLNYIKFFVTRKSGMSRHSR